MSWKWLFVSPLLFAGCNGTDGEDEPVCPRGRPAFDVRLTAADGSVPGDLELSVTVGGSVTETFPAHGRGKNDVLCCVRGEGDGLSFNPATCGEPTGDASTTEAGHATVIHCQVWSNGAAQVEVDASGYAPLEQILTARADADYAECATWETQPVELRLTRGDAGVLQDF
jgi:hypothetical protein